MQLADKVAVITGGTRGIGAAMAHRFVDAGANVVLVARHAPDSELLESLQRDGQQVVAVVGAIDDPDFGQALAAQVAEQFGQIDILVNNAGITRDMLAMRMTPAQFDEVVQVNLNGTFYVTQPIFKRMLKARNGVIVNVASVVGLTGNIGQANYAASKAGIIGLTKTLAQEGALRGVRVNALAPGMIQTAMTDALSDAAQAAILERIALKRLGVPDEIAHAAQFLIENDYITGQVVTVDGGLS